jgi:hypothetical protein
MSSPIWKKIPGKSLRVQRAHCREIGEDALKSMAAKPGKK